MAQETIVRLIDDLDGGDAEESVEFGLDGQMYKIDLSSKNADELREVMAPFVVAAAATAKMPRSARQGLRGRAKAVARRDPQQAQAVRAWAIQHGYQVSNRGRISREVQAAFDAAM